METTSLFLLKEFKKHRVYKYALSVVIIFFATLIQFLCWDYIKPAPFLFYYPAIILAALYGDGTSAIILSCILGQYYFVPPMYSFELSFPNDYLRMSIFLFAALLIRKIVHNQTEDRLKAESAIQLLNEEKYEREKFVSTLTHDLQTPLTSAKLNIQLLKRKEHDSSSTNQITKITTSIGRIEYMIRDLLDANQIRAGKPLPLNLEVLNLKDVLEETALELREIFGDRFDLRGKLDVTGKWSKDGIKRIIENLCSNAVKYGSPDDRICIMIDPADFGVLISVNNKGKVITQDEQKYLFDPYARTRSAIKSNQKGWGLGLTLVKAITEAHKGQIKVESTAEHGTTFTVLLPRGDLA